MITITNPDNIYFISDTHFFHENIIKNCDRPFKDVNEMNETLINNWNDVISNEDDVYVIGDFCFNIKGGAEARVDKIDFILKKLNGKIKLVKGNHDKEYIKYYKNYPKLIEIFDDSIVELKIKDSELEQKQKVILCHYSLGSWNYKSHGAWHIHGHSHDLPVNLKNDRGTLCVSVERTNYKPLSWKEVKAAIFQKFKDSKEIF